MKQTGNVFQSVFDTALKNHETYEKNLIEGTDEKLKDYVYSLNTRLNGLIQKIANEFYINKEEGKYINTEEDNYDEKNFHVTDNISFVISNASDTATISMLTKGVDNKIVKLSANICGISVSALHNAVQGIVDQKDKEIKVLFTLILQLFLEDGKHQPEAIRSKDFINFCLEVYMKSNTSDATILRIKELLDEWLVLCSTNYLKTERVATKINFRKATLLYFIFILQQSYSYKR